MNDESNLRALFEAVLALPAAQRGAFLRERCPDPAQRARIERLLAADADGAEPLPAAAADDLVHAIGEEAEPVWQPGEQIAEWRLETRLGEGGSATVFRAMRDLAGVRQRAAIKLLRRGLYSPEAQRQFRRERQALAALVHPNIAHLIDGGVTAAGIPYLVMEYVDGVPITEHACAAQLDLRARLGLMSVACRAVAAAHRNLIVHRDLKPANILVAGDGTVKLLDFGIAKLLDAEAGDPADATRSGYAPLTPGYAAPEQYAGGTISTATDVYALGVVLHELLLGERPQRERPTRPSVRLGDIATDLWRLPAARPALRAALRGDLDNIILKALAEEPQRRYAGAAELADDLDRYLDKRPVHAHPPSRWYLTRKFVQRHRGGVIVTAALAVGLVTSLALALWQAAVARQQTLAAQRQSQRAEAVSAFLVDLFDNQIPTRPGDATPGTDVLLERGVQRALTELHDTPALQGGLLLALARVYDHLARGEQARPLLQSALAAARRAQPADPALLAQVMSEYGALELQLGHDAEARTWLDQALALQAEPAHDPLKRALSLDRRALAASWLGDHDAALADYRQALALRLAHLPDDDPEVINSRHAIGSALIRAGRGDEATPWIEQAAAAAQARFGDDHVKTAHYRKTLADVLVQQERLIEGIALLERAVASERRLYPPGHPDRGNGLSNLGQYLWRAGRLAEAQIVLDEGIALLRVADQEAPVGIGFMLGSRARISEARGQFDLAQRELDEAMRITQARLGADHARTLHLELQRARIQALTDDDPAAAAALAAHAERLIAAPERLAQYRVRGLIEARHALAFALDRQGRMDEAAAVRQQNLDRAPPGRIDALLLDDVAALARWLAAQGRTDEARRLLDAWLDRGHSGLPTPHYALGELHLVAVEIDPRSEKAAHHRDEAAKAFAELPAEHPWRQRLAGTAR